MGKKIEGNFYTVYELNEAVYDYLDGKVSKEEIRKVLMALNVNGFLSNTN